MMVLMAEKGGETDDADDEAPMDGSFVPCCFPVYRVYKKGRSG
jgi:hypothetical protein